MVGKEIPVRKFFFSLTLAACAAGFASDVERCFALDSASVAIRFEQGVLFAVDATGARFAAPRVAAVH